MKKIGRLGAVILLALVILVFLPQITHFFTDLLWFQELEYQSVFITWTFAKFIIGGVVFLLVFILSYLTLFFTTKYHQPTATVVDDTVVDAPQKKIIKKRLIIIPALIMGLFAGWLSATALWENILLFLNQTSANVVDPIFGRDLSFYFFNYSLLETIYYLAMLFFFIIFMSSLLLTLYLQGPNKHGLKIMGKRIVYFIVVIL